MGLFSTLASIGGAVNPVGMIGSAMSVGSDIMNYFGNQQTNQVNAQNVANTNATNEAIANNSNLMQEDLAKNGLSYKIQDAAAYGISPLAAIGAVSPTINPAIPAIQTPSYQSSLPALGSALKDAGQNMDRALTVQMTPEQKAQVVLDLQHSKLENDLLDAQIKNARLATISHANAPGIPISTATAPIPSAIYGRDADGNVTPYPNPDLGLRFADSPGASIGWMLDNKLIPAIDNIYWNTIGFPLQDMRNKYLGPAPQ